MITSENMRTDFILSRHLKEFDYLQVNYNFENLFSEFNSAIFVRNRWDFVLDGGYTQDGGALHTILNARNVGQTSCSISWTNERHMVDIENAVLTEPSIVTNFRHFKAVRPALSEVR